MRHDSFMSVNDETNLCILYFIIQMHFVDFYNCWNGESFI